MKYRFVRKALKFHWIPIELAIIYLTIELVWKQAFIYGKVVGIYWLFVFFDRFLIPVIKGCVGLSAILLMVWVIIKVAGKDDRTSIFSLSAGLFVAAIILALGLLNLFAQDTIHETSIVVKGNRYYLASYPMFDINYGVYQCDIAGIMCKSIFHSGDIMYSEPDAQLLFDEKTSKLTLSVGEPIFSYSIP